MRPHQSFSVVPQLPEPLDALRELAWNLRFSWDPSTVELFRMMDRDLWDQCGRNPVLFLGRISQARLEECAKDDAILANLQKVGNDHSKYLASDATWYAKQRGDRDGIRIAYFSAEFGLSAQPAALLRRPRRAGRRPPQGRERTWGLPLVGGGPPLPAGVFPAVPESRTAGSRRTTRPTTSTTCRCTRCANAEGRRGRDPGPAAGRKDAARQGVAGRGRARAAVAPRHEPARSTSPEHRTITFELYGGDTETRLLQEYVLGVGGDARAVRARATEPDICHMNEGHSAFLGAGARSASSWSGTASRSRRRASPRRPPRSSRRILPCTAAVDLFEADQMERHLQRMARDLRPDPEDTAHEPWARGSRRQERPVQHGRIRIAELGPRRTAWRSCMAA